jgi:hypothetical protein
MSRALAALAVLLLLGACGPDDVTQARLQDALATSFANLYVRQQALLGQPGIATAAVAPRVRCGRPGSTSLQGAGEWTCTVSWFGGDGAPLSGEYDVQAKAGGCFTATGQPVAVGAPQLRAPDGTTFVNPIYGIDGCFAT